MSMKSPKISQKIPEEEILHKAIRISKLTNAFHFFVHLAVIIEEKEEEKVSYRLVVKNPGVVLLDKRYPTLRGAKIAFGKFFRNKYWKVGTDKENEKQVCDWSPIYMTDQDVLTLKKKPEKKEKD